jgi:hypothetical protein
MNLMEQQSSVTGGASRKQFPISIVDCLEPGMEVAEDVLNVNGTLLLAKGTVLSDHLIRVLKMWGVETIRVGGEAGAAHAPTLETVLRPEILAAAKRKIEERFRHVSEVMPAVRVIKQLALDRLAQRLAATTESEPQRP